MRHDWIKIINKIKLKINIIESDFTKKQSHITVIIIYLLQNEKDYVRVSFLHYLFKQNYY